MWSRETSHSALSLSLYGHKNFKFTVSFRYPSSTLASFDIHLGVYSYVSNPAKEKGIIKATKKFVEMFKKITFSYSCKPACYCPL